MSQIPLKLIVCSAVLLLLQFAAFSVNAQKPTASPTPMTKEEALFEAIANVDLPAVQKLIAAGANVNARNENDESVLIQATSLGDGQVAERILQAVVDGGADLKTDEAKVLDNAAQSLDSGLLKLLLKAGVDVKARDDDGKTAIFFASAENVKFLVDLGLNVNDRDRSQRTPLIGIISAERAKALIDAGANVNVADDQGDTPMHMAASFGDEDFIRLLLAAGADINPKNNRGETPLSYALNNQRGSTRKTSWDSVIRLLRSKGAVDPRAPIRPTPTKK